MKRAPQTTLLCILDGFGLNPNPEGNAVHLARTPNFDRMWTTLPVTTLVTSGLRVGLPEGQMGNSEVGHLNIGAGRVVEQPLVRISRELREGLLAGNGVYQAFLKSIAGASTIHLIGLYSDGGVHSHLEHLQLLIAQLSKDTSKPIALHLITDGRDTPPQSGLVYVQALSEFLRSYPNCRIATVSGRYFAMDRDKRWDRTHNAYNVIVRSEGPQAENAEAWIAGNYERGVTDEFIEPGVIHSAPIKPQDGVIFWNFRADRMRQLVRAMCIDDFDGFERPQPVMEAGHTLCFTEYDATFGLPFLFAPIEIINDLGELLAKAGKTQFRVAETEKYAHVTYFFNGGSEKEYPNEKRRLVPSPREVKTYDQKPEMSAFAVCDILVDAIASREYDFIVVNFANADMVGHTGILDAAIKAVEAVDVCVGRIFGELAKQGGQGILIADHGNAEQMVEYDDASPYTAHTTYPVPCILFGLKEEVEPRNNGSLCDVAPTVLKMMGLPQPAEMTGKPLY